MDNHQTNLTKVEKRADSCCITDLAIDNITVYLEKAEITRSAKYEIFANQILECTFEQLPSSIEKDSIRIEVVNSAVSIQDVTFNIRPVNNSSEQSERVTKIRELIRIERQNQESLEAKKLRLLKQRNVLDAFANTLIESNTNVTETNSGEPQNAVDNKKVHHMIDAYNPKHLETLGNFFKLYSDNGENFDEKLLDVEEKLNQSMVQIKSWEHELKEIEIRQDEQLYRELLVILEGKQDGEFEMCISYVVNNCNWRPIYDVRVSNSNGSMQINYYGIIKQKCGEDWYQASKYNLSTAEPGVGGTVPDLKIQKVQFKTPFSTSQSQGVFFPVPTSPVASNPNLKKSASRLSSFRKSRSPSFNVFESNTLNRSTPIVNDSDRDNQHFFDDKVVERPFSSLGTSFEIARPPTLVTCDNVEYRVMIAVINLEPHYQHVTVPKYSPYAYLRSFATNSSKFTLLEGPVNIYIDSNFIGKTKLPTVCPCEEFFCNLGVDKGIKVNYMPMFKYKETNQKSMCITFKQEINVINNHERPITILVVDQLPFSNDEKIKVNLIEPMIKNLDKYDKQKPTRINSNRQIEWDCEIGSKDKKCMTLKFTVEHPYGKDIEVMQIK